MALFYTGKRPVTKGRNWRDESDLYHAIGTYSNRSLLNPSQVLDGAPNTNTVLGVLTRLSAPRLMEMVFSGAHNIEPMVGAGAGIRLTSTYGRFRPLEYKGMAGTKAFGSGFGHAIVHTTAYDNYSNFVYDGIVSAEPLAEIGHVIRYTTTYGGASAPWLYHGAAHDKALDEGGHTVSANPASNLYGNQKVNQWFGVPSAKALL